MNEAERLSAKLAYLEMVQGVINRLASTSATFKGLAVTLAAGALAIAVSGVANTLALLLVVLAGIIAIACFDCWYFLMEKRYRCLYDAIREEAHPFDFDMHHPMKDDIGVFDTFSSPSIWLFYLVVVAIFVTFTILCQVGVV